MFDNDKTPVISTAAVRRARQHVDSAIDCHMAGSRDRTLKELHRALQLNPNLVNDTVFTNLAGQVLGTAPDEALRILHDAERLKVEVQTASTVRPKAAKKSSVRPLSVVLLVASTLLLVGLAYWFVDSGLLDRYRQAYDRKRNVHTLNGQEYFLHVPDGAEPVDGWAVIVALHGYGGTGDSMLHPDLLAVADEGRAILIAPTLGTYSDDSTRFELTNVELQRNLDAVLNKIAEDYRLNSRGTILYGFSRGGMFATEFMVNYAHRIDAIVAEGAPDVIVPGNVTNKPRLIFLYGEQDGLQNFTYPRIQALEQAGFPVTFEILPQTGHTMTGRGMEWLSEMVRQAHSS